MPNQYQQKSRHLTAALRAAMVVFLVLSAAGTAAAQIIYNSIPSPLPGNVASRGPEAYQFIEQGDGLIFAGTQRRLTTITVIMSDWACTSGSWTVPAGNPGACVTTPGDTWTHPITMNIYKVLGGPVVGPLVATKTVTFTIPFRPSSDAAHCGVGGSPGGDGEQWYSVADNTCYHGFAFPITFDFTLDGVVLDSSNIVTVAFNTNTEGPVPIGAPGPYDSLNISDDGNPTVGAVLDPNGIWVNYRTSGNSCSGAAPTGTVIDDTPCFTDLHPEFLVNTVPTDAFQISYAANLNAGDSFVNLTNAGTVDGPEPIGNICANIYVLAADQQLIGCCSCLLTPNHLKGISVLKDLVAKPLTPGLPPEVSIVVAASAATACNPAQAPAFVPGLRAWSVTLHSAPAGGFMEGETKFQLASPSGSELFKLTSYCGFIQANGSGNGICGACTAAGSAGVPE